MITTLIFDSSESLSHYAAMSIIANAQRAIAQRGIFSLVLSGGSTPQRLYELLATPALARQIEWPKVHLFWGDERVIPPSAEGSNYRQAKLALLDHVPLPAQNVWRIKGELLPRDGALDYAKQLKQAGGLQNWPRFDLVLLGMGGDGHTASLFPNAPIVETQSTRAVMAHYQDRPVNRVTLTSPVINSARQVWFLVTGSAKAEMVRRVLCGEGSPMAVPALRIRPKNLTWLLDQDAAQLT